VSKPSFQADLPASLKKELGARIAKQSKAIKRRMRKAQQVEMQYHPGRISPLSYLTLKILYGQFGESSQPAFPLAIRLVRKFLFRSL